MRSQSGEIDPGLRYGRVPGGSNRLGGTPHEVVVQLGGEGIAPLEQRREDVVDDRGDRLTERADAEAVRAVLGDCLDPDVDLGLRPGHLAVLARELRVLVDRQRARRERVPALAPPLRLRRLARDLNRNRAELLELHR